jgi:hypothetical protein
MTGEAGIDKYTSLENAANGIESQSSPPFMIPGRWGQERYGDGRCCSEQRQREATDWAVPEVTLGNLHFCTQGSGCQAGVHHGMSCADEDAVTALEVPAGSMRRNEMSNGSGSQSSGRETTLVDNEVYNLIATIHSKLEGLAAYEKYEKDGQANDPIWRELQQQDEQAVRRLMQQLEQFGQQGKLKAR